MTYSNTVRKPYRIVWLAIALLAMLFVNSQTVRAQGVSPVSFSLEVGPMGGVSSPKGDASDFYKSGYNIGGMAWLSFGQLGVRGEMSYQKMKTKDVAFGTSRYSGSLKQTGFLISGTYFPLPTPVIKPYLILGAGSYKTTMKLGDSVEETEINSESTDFAIAGGVGAKLSLARLGIFLEGRYMTVSTESNSTKSLLVSGGLIFSLI